jgi:transposase
MKRVAAKSVPRLLIEDQRKSRLTACQDLKRELENYPNFLPHPPYSPDLARADCFLFPQMKRDLNGGRFDTVEDIITASTRALNSIQVEEFQRCFEQLQEDVVSLLTVEGLGNKQ